jgi:hypothetical protein
MRNTTMVAMSAAAAAAAAAISGDAASATTPDWLTLVSVDSDHESLLPVLCDESAGPLSQITCDSMLATDTEDMAASHGWEVPEAPEGPSIPAVATVDLRNFAKWQICGNNVAAVSQDAACDNSSQVADDGPVESSNGISLVNADTTGAFR